jgi:hypothetical protein
VTPRLDEWIATLADPEDLARGQEVDPVVGAGYAALQRQLSEANGKVAALVTAVESGVAVEDLTAALRRRTAERDELKARLEPKAPAPCLPHRSASWSRSWAACQRCLVRQPGRNALRCTQAWVCVLITIRICDESRRRPT